MARIGATPEQLTDLKSVFDNQGNNIDALMSAISSRLDAVDWQGPAHDRFVQAWNTEFKTALRRLQESLRVAGAEAHAAGQRILAAGS